MRRLIWLITVITLFFQYGCEKCLGTNPMSESITITLTWENYDGESQIDPNKAIYLLNGEIVGSGSEGIAAVIKRLGSVSEGTELLIYPDRYVLEYWADPKGGEWEIIPKGYDPVPFRRMPTLYQKLQDVARQQKIDIWYLEGSPGDYVLENGQDLRLKDGYLYYDEK